MAISFANDQNYDELISEGFVIVDFYSTTCVPCKMLSRILEDLTVDYPFINIVKVNTTDYPKLGKDNDIDAVPTILFINDGELKERVVGLMDEEEIIEKISAHYYG